MALLAQCVLLATDIALDETFTAVYVLPPLALALVERVRPVTTVGLVGIVFAAASGVWNENLLSFGHVLRFLIVATGAVLAVLSAQARAAVHGARRGAEATGRRLDAILSVLAEAVTVNDEQGNVLYANEAAARLLGAESVDEVLNAKPGELAARFISTKEDGSPLTVDDLPGRQVIAGETPEPLLLRSVNRATGESFWTVIKATAFVDEHGRRLGVNIIEDVTEEREADLRQRFLERATQVLASSLDYDETLQRIAWLAVPTFADWCALDVIEHGELERVALAHRNPAKLAIGREVRERYPPDLRADVGLSAVIRSGEAAVYPEIPDEMIEAGARDAEHLRLIRELGMRSAMVIPMRAGGQTIGALTFVNADSGRTFDEDDRLFAEDLAARAATAVENARLYSRLAQTAETLQRSLLPERLAQPPGWRAEASYRAGERGSKVGGDFYDLFAVPGGWMVILGDVTGKGVKAAAQTALVRHTVKTSARFDSRPAAVLRVVNDVLREQPELAIVTLVAARLREADGGVEAEVVSAGHPLPLRIARDGSVEPIGRHDLVLGAADEGVWSESVVTVAPGETLFFYTDGVTELPGDSERFGEQRLHDAVATAGSNAAGLITHLERLLDDFQAAEHSDDRAMLALEWVGAANPAEATLSH